MTSFNTTARATLEEGTKFLDINGRVGWTLNLLVEKGKKGISSYEYPGVRLSHYIFMLRHEYGLEIDTIEVPHTGPFPGFHGRYVLRTPVEIISVRGAA